MGTKETQVLLTSRSPVCDLEAALTREADGWYFSLLYHPDAERKIIRRCRIGDADLPLHADRSVIVWYPSCDSAAVFHEDDLLCAIPPESSSDDPGFSRYVKEPTLQARPFSPDPETEEKRVLEGVKFWGWLSKSDWWTDIKNHHLHLLENFFGKHEKYFAIDGGKFPARALAVGRRGGTVYGMTIGMSLFPMPKASLFCGKYAQDFCRTELGFAASEQLQGFTEIIAPQISWMAAHPWEHLTMLMHGDTVNLRDIPGFPAAILLHPEAIGTEKPDYPAFWGDPINLLWVVPITQQEFELRYAKGGGVQALLNHAASAGKLHIFDGKPKFLR